MENNKTVKIVFATGNPHKLQEINEISKGSGVEFILPPAGFDPIEMVQPLRKILLLRLKKLQDCRIVYH